MYKATYCPNCISNGRINIEQGKRCAPCFEAYVNKELDKCEYCHHPVKKMNLDSVEFGTILNISGETSFIQAMDNLKQKNPIEFQLKMSQFKTQVQQQESSNSTNTTPTKDVIHCPKCNSTAITTGARGVNNFWGLFGASKTVNRCGNCGYTWKPHNW